MGILSDALSKKTIPVFGTQSFKYDTTEFDRQRDDGFSIIDLMPECRVFIGGAEVTKDVITVNISHALSGGVGGGSSGGGSTCNITLANPRGKYEITKQDLIGKWREDKDILAMYDYDYLKKDPGWNLKDAIGKFLNSQELNNTITNTIAGATGSPLIGGLGGAAIAEGIKNIKNTNAQTGLTRMLFEVKHASGLYKHAGDIVFDYKDPVYVFMKGRFSYMWYFAFSGVVTTWDESDSYGDSNTISLKCESIMYLLKKSKVQERGALVAAGNFESTVMGNSTSASTSFYDHVNSFSLTDMIKVIIYGRDYYSAVRNNHISASPIYLGGGDPSVAYENAYTATDSSIRGDDMLNAAFPVFSDKFNFTTGLIDLTKYNISDINSTAHGPNSMKLSPWQLAYFQYNQLDLQDSKNLNLYTQDSVRFWEKSHMIDSAQPIGDYTGWQDSKAFGVRGMHPAVTYEFINNFGILADVWGQIKDVATKPLTADKTAKLNLSPYDKLVESVAGSSTEARTGTAIGTNLNAFRPRLFVVIPQRYKPDHPVNANAFGAFQLTKESAATVYDSLTKGTSGLDYSVYATPMGDLVVEPNWYDTHPLDYWPDGNSIVIRGKTRKTSAKIVRQYDSNAKEDFAAVQAYDYNSDNAHPFFIMQKDVGRFTQTFSPELIKTKITVTGSNGTGSSVTESIAVGDIADSLSILGAASNSDSAFQHGIYVADGFKDSFKRIVKSFVGLQGTILTQAMAEYTTFCEQQFFLQLPNMLTSSIGVFYQSIMDSITKVNGAMFSAYLQSKDNPPLGLNTTGLSKEVDLSYFLDFISIGDNLGLLDGTILDEDIPGIIQGYANLTQIDMSYIQIYMPECFNIIHDKINGVLDTTIELSTLVPYYSDGSILTYDTYKSMSIANHTLDNILIELKNFFTLGLIYGSPSSSFTGTSGDQQTAVNLLSKICNLSSTAGFSFRIRTLADLHKIADQGFYDPQVDMVRRYGFNNNQEEVSNFYVRNGREATFYATVIFQKLFAGAFTFNMNTVGRPEYMLNKSYYCERKDALGLLAKYTLAWTNGSDFSSDVELTYIRKNALTYDYSLGDLDNIRNTDHNNNAFFKAQATKYYAWQKLSTMLSSKVSAATNAVGTGAAGKLGIPNSAVVGDEIAGLTSLAISQIEVGGLYSVHLPIGHIDYDMASSAQSIDPVTSAVGNVLADATNIQTIYNDFFGTSVSGTDNVGLMLIVLQKLTKAIDLIQTSCVGFYTQYAAAYTKLIATQDEIITKFGGTAPPKEPKISSSAADSKIVKDTYTQYSTLINDQTTTQAAVDRLGVILDNLFNSLYGSATNYPTVSKIGYAAYITQQTRILIRAGKVSGGTSVTGVSGKTFSSEVSALSYIQQNTINSFKRIMGVSTPPENSLYYPMTTWLVPTDTITYTYIPDYMTATDNTPVTFAQFGSLSPVYYTVKNAKAGS